jgi:hypothetical protein
LNGCGRIWPHFNRFKTERGNAKFSHLETKK